MRSAGAFLCRCGLGLLTTCPQRGALLIIASALLSMMALAGCGLGSFAANAPTPPPGDHRTPTASLPSKLTFLPGYSLAQPSEYSSVRFALGVTYSQALQLVTDLGLQPVPWCLGAQFDAGAWSSPNEEPQFGPSAGGPPGSGLGLFTAAATPAGWLPLLARLPQTLGVQNGVIHCPLIPIETPDATTGSFLSLAGVFTPLAVQFSPSVQYDQALQEVMALGFALNAPCPDQTPASSADPVGQEASYASSHTLRVTTTFANSTLWRTQLKQAAGVIAEQNGAAAACS